MYKQEPGYQAGQASLFTLDPGAPEDLPDNLRGERWGFVQLPLSEPAVRAQLVIAGEPPPACPGPLPPPPPPPPPSSPACSPP